MTDTQLAAPPAQKLGRPYTPIPDSLEQLLEASYTGDAQSVEVRDGDNGQVREAVRLARIYARRHDKTLHWQISDGRLWLQMTDKRRYTRRNT